MTNDQQLVLSYLKNPYCEPINANFSEMTFFNPVTKQAEKNPVFSPEELEATELIFYLMQASIYWIPKNIKDFWENFSEGQKQEIILSYLFYKNIESLFDGWVKTRYLLMDEKKQQDRLDISNKWSIREINNPYKDSTSIDIFRNANEHVRYLADTEFNRNDRTGNIIFPPDLALSPETVLWFDSEEEAEIFLKHKHFENDYVVESSYQVVNKMSKYGFID